MIALLDGDVVVYRCGFANNEESEGINVWQAEEMIKRTLADIGTDKYELYLSDTLENNYRFKFDPEYKANRKDMAKPVHYKAIRQRLLDEWGAVITEGEEADDMLGIRQTEESNTTVCSIDKDLLQIPGNHYDLAKRTFQSVEYTDGLRHFYKQLLIGDRVDNITGVWQIGPKKAAGLLDSVVNEVEMFDRVRTLYNDDERLLKNGRLLWIRRHRGEIWNFPIDRSEFGGSSRDNYEDDVGEGKSAETE